jgi:rod shape-determining protein MreB and related proteins
MAEKDKDKEVLHVGIDLGTSRSSISASNGQRHVVESYVGWPLDMVARKVLKKPVLIGSEALENRSMLDLHRPLEQGLIKEGSDQDEAAVRELLRHLVSLVGVDVGNRSSSKKVRAVVGVPAEALRVNKQQVRKALQGAVDSLMIVSEPFAVAYGMEALLHTLVIDSGAGTTDLCVMNGRLPTEEDQRTLPQAGDWVDEQLLRLVRARYPEASVSIHMVRQWKEEGSFVGNSKTPVVVTAPVAGKPTQLDITNEMRQACEGILPPVVESMLDLLSRAQPDYQEKIRNNVVVSGGTGLIRGLGPRLEQELQQVGGGKVRVVKDPIYVGSDGGLAIAMDAPESDWERLTK